MSNPTTYGYLERAYLSDPYMAGYATMAYGMQVTMVIAAAPATGMQVKQQDSGSKPTGMQVKAQAAGAKPTGVQTLMIDAGSQAKGVQVKGQIAATKASGVQVKALVNKTKATGVQTLQTLSKQPPTGVQVKGQIGGNTTRGMQAKAQIGQQKPTGVQTLAVLNKQSATAAQVRTVVQAASAKGSQVRLQVNQKKALAAQVRAVVNVLSSYGVQVKSQIAGQTARGVQVKAIAAALKTTAFQVNAVAQGGKPVAFQVKGLVVGARRGYGVQAKLSNTTFKYVDAQAKRGNFAHWDVNGYLVAPYLTGDYLIDQVVAQGGVQVNQMVSPKQATGVQVKGQVQANSATGAQTRLVINSKNAQGLQVFQRLIKSKAVGVQVRGLINKLTSLGVQVYPYISVKLPIGMQVTSVEGKLVGMQVTVVLYNATNLRILSSFPSRGNGSNWTASSTAPGDFSANNLNTDIVEQQWRSSQGTTVGVTLDSDTGVSSVFVDTVAILNHNFSTSAQVTLQGSAFADQHIVAVSIPLPVTKGNIIWVSPTLPNVGVRYWRVIINDPTNPQGQLRAGTIVFGSSMIFENDNITVNVKKTRVHFADKVATEGFTDVMNDRALKTQIEINFDNLKYDGGNFQALDTIFQTVRTSLKALWIPDPAVPTRFGVFGKLPVIPSENHNNLGPDRDYVQLTINVDESL